VAGKEDVLIPRAALILLILAVCATAGDPKLATLESRISAQDRTITDLRSELALARAGVQNRIDTARSGLEFAKAALEAKLDQARNESAATETLIASKEQIIHELSTQVDQLRARPAGDSATTVAVIADAATAIKSAAKVATTRHALDTAELKTTSSLAGSAAGSARQAVDLGQANRIALLDALLEIERLTGIIDVLSRSEVVGRRLLVIVAVLIVLVLAVVVLRFRR
jgi:uncharacterized coiled-coil protein SlyX